MPESIEHILSTIDDVRGEFDEMAGKASLAPDVENLRLVFMSRKGKVPSLFPLIGAASSEDRPRLGAELNQLRDYIQSTLDELKSSLEKDGRTAGFFDRTLPGRPLPIGSLHPLLQVMDEIKQIFIGMGFRVEEGAEIETDYYNFEALNIPPHHPSRDMHDTFYLGGNLLLRTHTSPVQIHTMETQKPPIRMIAPGRCFRKDAPDATHSPIFHQVEGLVVDRGVSFADLKGVVQAFAQKLLGKEVKVRFRPSFFPFTEPSAEYDFSCIFCGGKGCRVCKQTGWLEISGAGMVDPAVFAFVDINPEIYSGYAFGMGVERIAMLLLGVHDIRIFFENDVRFLEQF
jgi:phenylalanyl-tRNA synthetase alpha chain